MAPIMNVDVSILFAGRVLGTLVFGLAVIGKLRHRQEFMGVVANYRLLPEVLVIPAARFIIVLESVVAASLSTGIGLSAGALLAVFLLALFAAAIAVNLARGRKEIDCGCFQSALRQRLSAALVIRNLALIAIVLPLIGTPPATVSLFQVLNGVAAGVVLFVLYQVFDQLSALGDSAAALRKRFS